MVRPCSTWTVIYTHLVPKCCLAELKLGDLAILYGIYLRCAVAYAELKHRAWVARDRSVVLATVFLSQTGEISAVNARLTSVLKSESRMSDFRYSSYLNQCRWYADRALPGCSNVPRDASAMYLRVAQVRLKKLHIDLLNNLGKVPSWVKMILFNYVVVAWA